MAKSSYKCKVYNYFANLTGRTTDLIYNMGLMCLVNIFVGIDLETTF